MRSEKQIIRKGMAVYKKRSSELEVGSEGRPQVVHERLEAPNSHGKIRYSADAGVVECVIVILPPR